MPNYFNYLKKTIIFPPPPLPAATTVKANCPHQAYHLRGNSSLFHFCPSQTHEEDGNWSKNIWPLYGGNPLCCLVVLIWVKVIADGCN